MIPVLVSILEAIVEQVGLPLLLQWIAGNNDQAQVQAILDAEYKAARLAADAEAKAVLGAP